MIVDNALYRNGKRIELGLALDDLEGVGAHVSEEHDYVWVGLHEPTTAEMSTVARVYDLHPLAVEDAFKAHQRPKLEHYDHELFLVLKTLRYVEEDDAVETGEISCFIGEHHIITVRHGQGSALSTARAYLDREEQVCAHGPSAVVYVVADHVVDQYESVADSLAQDVDEVEFSVFSPGRTNDSERIYILKREIAEMRRAVLPMREPINRFSLGNMPGIHSDAAPYFRDVADHLARIQETIDGLDSLLSTAFDAHIAQISLQQNEDMRKISAAVGLVATPTLIAGIYGMNFTHMPELHWFFGYPFALLSMIASSLAIFIVARRAGWL